MQCYKKVHICIQNRGIFILQGQSGMAKSVDVTLSVTLHNNIHVHAVMVHAH